MGSDEDNNNNNNLFLVFGSSSHKILKSPFVEIEVEYRGGGGASVPPVHSNFLFE